MWFLLDRRVGWSCHGEERADDLDDFIEFSVAVRHTVRSFTCAYLWMRMFRTPTTRCTLGTRAASDQSDSRVSA